MIWFKRPATSLGPWPSPSMALTVFPLSGLPGESGLELGNPGWRGAGAPLPGGFFSPNCDLQS